jgi:hypothetical protein
LERLEFKDATIFVAIDEWKQACEKLGVKVSVYVDPTVSRNHDSLTLDIRNKTAIECLKIIRSKTLSALQIELSGDHLLIGFGRDLRVQRTNFQSWFLKPETARRLGLPDEGNDRWISVESQLAKKGIVFPPGCYADYRPDIRAVVVINHPVILESVGEWIGELEHQAVIEDTKGKGVTQMDGYSLETRSFALPTTTTALLHGYLFDKKGRLVPFAASTADILESVGVIAPLGSAFWLDHQSKTLWLRTNTGEWESIQTKIDSLEEIEAHTSSRRSDQPTK